MVSVKQEGYDHNGMCFECGVKAECKYGSRLIMERFTNALIANADKYSPFLTSTTLNKEKP